MHSEEWHWTYQAVSPMGMQGQPTPGSPHMWLTNVSLLTPPDVSTMHSCSLQQLSAPSLASIDALISEPAHELFRVPCLHEDGPGAHLSLDAFKKGAVILLQLEHHGGGCSPIPLKLRTLHRSSVNIAAPSSTAGSAPYQILEDAGSHPAHAAGAIVVKGCVAQA